MNKQENKNSKKEKETMKILTLHEKGYSNKEISEKSVYSYTTVCRILKKNGYGKEVSKEKKKQRLKTLSKKAYLYYQQEDITLEDVQNKYNMSYHNVRNMFLNEGLLLKDTGYKPVILNEDYFEEINTRDKAYLLGFLNCDGSLLERKGNSKALVLEVQNKDKEILEFLLNELGTSHDYIKTYKRNGSITSKIYISSPKIFKYLYNKGLRPSKMGNKKMPKNVPKDFYNALILGIFDADGSLKGQDYFSVSGGGSICYEISEFLFNTLNLKKKPSVREEKPIEDKPHWNTIPRLTARKKESKIIFGYLHKDKGFSLKRKLPTYIRNN